MQALHESKASVRFELFNRLAQLLQDEHVLDATVVGPPHRCVLTVRCLMTRRATLVACVEMHGWWFVWSHRGMGDAADLPGTAVRLARYLYGRRR